jgi:hypothetical protein
MHRLHGRARAVAKPPISPNPAKNLVSRIEVGKVIKRGNHTFDPNRVKISWQSPAVGFYFSRDEAGKLTSRKRLRKSA